MADNQEKAKKSLPVDKILKAGFIVLNLVLTGGGAFLAYQATLGHQMPSITEEMLEAQLAKSPEQELNVPLLFTMDKFTVNLDGMPQRTIQVELNLEMLNKEGFEEVFDIDNKAKARDKVVRILNGKSYDDLESLQGKLFLKDEIIVALNDILPQGIIKDIYFSQFVVQ